MKGNRYASVPAMLLLAAFAGSAVAEDISTKKMAIKDHLTDPAKRQIQLQSKDAGVLYMEADDPATNGASVHVWSDTDNFCYVLTASELWADNGKGWKYNNPDTKNQAQIADGKLKVKIRSGVTFDLADDGTQGTVNASVQFGPLGSRYCMHCTAPTHDEAKKYQAKDCVAAPCDLEPGTCDPVPTTTTSTTSTTTTTLGAVLKALLPATTGRFNFSSSIGLDAAEAACDGVNPATDVCTYADYQAAEAAGDLDGIKDPNGATVTSFWAVDPARPESGQCGQNLSPGSERWTYATGHLGIGGDKVSLNNLTGVLGPLENGGDPPDGSLGRNCFSQSWVGCCQ